MIVSISGVGGTGKTSVAKLFVKNLNKKIKPRKEKYKLVELNKLAGKKDLYIGFDKARQSKIVKMGALKKEVNALRKKHENLLIEGLYAHFFDSDILIVLRCNPKVLEKRLKKKYKWPTKITENIEAEMINLITEESLPLHKPGSVFDVDTTGKTAKQTADIVKKIINNEGDERRKHIAGQIDWLRNMW